MSLAITSTGTAEVGTSKPTEYADNSEALESMGSDLDYKSKFPANVGAPFQTLTSMLRQLHLAYASGNNTGAPRAILLQMRLAIDAMLSQSPDRVPLVT